MHRTRRDGRPAILLAPRMVRATVASAALFTAGRDVAAQLPDSVTTAAAHALAQFDALCASPSARIWRTSLCGPMVLVDPERREAVANVRPPTGAFRPSGAVFLGALPPDIEVANTAFTWSGRAVTMVMLPLPADPFDRTRLLFHEAFHRVQARLAVPGANVVINALEERDARYWLRLELAALVAAQRVGNDLAARVALSDALLFRAYRHRLYPALDSLEAAQELSEGLAEYTGVVVAGRRHGRSTEAMAEGARRFLEARATFVRSYAYGGGPLLGLALDLAAPGWRTRIDRVRSLAGELARAIGWRPPAAIADSAAVRAAWYDAPTVAAAEDARAARRAAEVASLRARLVEGPVVMLQQPGLAGGFNPNTIVPLPGVGLVYPSRTVRAVWGALEVQHGGLLVANDGRTAWITAHDLRVDADPTRVSADGWTLRLAPGWILVPGDRRGDFRVIEATARKRAPADGSVANSRPRFPR